MVVFFVKSNENTYPKGRALMHMYRVIPQTKRGRSPISWFFEGSLILIDRQYHYVRSLYWYYTCVKDGLT